jgi:hypothetical protein
MWKRKTYIDLEKDKENLNESIKKNSIRKAIKRSIYFCIGSFAFLIIKALITGPEYNSDLPVPTNPIKFKELPEYLVTFLIISMAIALLVLLFSLLAPRYFVRNYITTVICCKCFKVKNLDNETNCECGGTFESLDLYMWIPDDAKNDLKNEA